MISRIDSDDTVKQMPHSVPELLDDRDDLGREAVGNTFHGAQRSRQLFLAIALFALCFSVYMLTYIGKLTAADETSLVSVAKSFTKHGSMTTDQLLWTSWEFGWQAQGNLGADGHLYSKKGIGVPLLLWPLLQLSYRIPHLGSIPAAMLLNPMICALIAVTVFAAAYRRGYPEKTAFVLAALGGIGTIIWPYSKTVFTEPASALFLVAAVYLISGRLTVGNGFLAGLLLGCALMVKMTNAIALPVFAGYVIYRYRWVQRIHDGRSLWKVLVALFVAPGLGVALTAALNQYRFGSWLSAGYAGGEAFTNPLLVGLRDLLFSSGESIFLFSPLFILAVVGMPLSWRRSRSQTLLLAGLIVVQLMLFAGWYDWRGGVAWGPRFLVPLTPFFLLLMLPLMHDWLFVRRGWRRSVLIGLTALSIGVQIVGVLTPYREVDSHWPILSALAWLRRSPLSALDIAWLEMPGRIDWLMLLLFAGIGLLSLALVGAVAHTPSLRPRTLTWMGVVLLALSLVGATWGAARPYLDRRMPVGDDYYDLLRRLAQVAGPGDPAIIDNHVRTDFFLSQDQSPAWQYGFLRSETLRPEAEDALSAMVRAKGHIWLISDRPANVLVSKPEEEWLDQHTFRVGEEAFSEYARLIHYYVPPAGVLEDYSQSAAFGDSILLDGYQLAEKPSWQAGDVISLALEWRLEHPLADSMTSSVQLLRPDSSLVWQRDLPLSVRQAGDSATVRYGIPLLVPASSGQYVLQLAVYDPANGRREPVTASGAGQGQDVFVLSMPVVE